MILVYDKTCSLFCYAVLNACQAVLVSLASFLNSAVYLLVFSRVRKMFTSCVNSDLFLSINIILKNITAFSYIVDSALSGFELDSGLLVDVFLILF